MTSANPEQRALDAERCIRDVVSLLSLSALWIGRDGALILNQMLEAVERLVPLRLALIEVPVLAGEAATFAGRVDSLPVAPETHAFWRETARQWQVSPVIMSAAGTVNATPLGELRIVRLDLGLSSVFGHLWLGSAGDGFPTSAQVTVLRAAVALAAMGLQAARSRHEREQALRAKDEFLAMLGHELRNPLAPIRSGAALLRLDGVTPQQVKQTGEVIERQVRHMTTLVDELLDVSRLSRGSIVLEHDTVDIKQVLEQAMEQLRPLLSARRHALSVQLAGGDAYVRGDGDRLLQVMSNLLSNAAKYTPPDGQLSLALSMTAGEVRIAVADNGNGIEPPMLEQIFGLFVQVRRSPDRSEGGLGVGLALAKRLVELHGGLIHAASDGLGKGATFTVVLPRLLGEI